jgi:CRP/FNR family cyclic AMP-dependent transcriptional regulator
MKNELGKVYQPGESIIVQGELGDCMFVILEGRAEIIRTEGENQFVVAILGEGDIFGEMSVVKRRRRSATVRALTPLRTLTVDRKTFLQRVQEDPSIALNLLQVMSERIENLDAELTELQAHITE